MNDSFAPSNGHGLSPVAKVAKGKWGKGGKLPLESWQNTFQLSRGNFLRKSKKMTMASPMLVQEAKTKQTLNLLANITQAPAWKKYELLWEIVGKAVRDQFQAALDDCLGAVKARRPGLRTAFVSIFILFVGALVFGFWPRPIQIYHDTNVTVGEMSRKIDLLFLHPSPQRSLEFAGKRYPAIRGSGPCYLEIPDLRSILFVTQDRSHLATAYIAELQTKTVTPIGLGDSTFGRSIGSGKQPGDNGSDYVTVTNGNKVVLVTRSRTREATTTLDLARRAVEREEVVSFDKTGAVTNRAVFVAGIQVFRACK